MSEPAFGELAKQLREIVSYHDDNVADELAREGERADLWTEVDAPVDLLRQAADMLDALGSSCSLIARERDLYKRLYEGTTVPLSPAGERGEA